jgi:hypothetical protein
MMGTDTMPKYWLPWLVGMPAEQSRAACCLIFGGVLERLPKLRSAWPMAAAASPTPSAASSTASACARTWWPPTTRAIRATTCSAVLRFLGRRRARCATCSTPVGVDRVMLGTDYPFPLGEQEPGAGIERWRWTRPSRRGCTTAPRWNGWEPGSFELELSPPDGHAELTAAQAALPTADTALQPADGSVESIAGVRCEVRSIDLSQLPAIAAAYQSLDVCVDEDAGQIVRVRAAGVDGSRVSANFGGYGEAVTIPDAGVKAWWQDYQPR